MAGWSGRRATAGRRCIPGSHRLAHHLRDLALGLLLCLELLQRDHLRIGQNGLGLGNRCVGNWNHPPPEGTAPSAHARKEAAQSARVLILGGRIGGENVHERLRLAVL